MTTVAVLAKVALLLLACWAIAWRLRDRGAATRHLVWAVGLAGAVTLPLVAVVLPTLPVAVLSPERVPVGLAPEGPSRTATPARVVWDDGRIPAAAMSSPLPGRETDVPWTILYGSVTALLLALSLGSRIRLRCLAAGARDVPPDDPRRGMFEALQVGADRNHRLLESDTCPGPMALGWRRGRVILPTASRAWPMERLRAVLRHEIEHLDRGDAVWGVVAEVACAVHWIDPLAWFAARWLRLESERACDDAVLRDGRAPSRYASDLLALSVERRWGWSHSGGFAEKGTLERRVEAVIDENRSRGRLGPRSRVLALVAAVALLPPLAAAVPVPAASPAGAPAEPEAGAVQVRWSGRGGLGGLALEGTIELDDPAAGDEPALFLVAFRGDDGPLRTLRSVRGPGGAWTVTTGNARPTGDGLDAAWVDAALSAAGRKLAGLGARVWWNGVPLGRADVPRRAPGLAGSVMTGLPATTEDSGRGTLLAGWRHGARRAGLFLCGTAGVDPWDTVDRLEASDDDALPDGDCLVAWTWHPATGSLRVLEVSASDRSPRARFAVNGAARPIDRSWLSDILATLDRPPAS